MLCCKYFCFIFATGKYTIILKGFCENSHLVTRVPQGAVVKSVKAAGLYHCFASH